MLRAVLYARCSTEEESQKDALIHQVAEAEECIVKKGWKLVGSYVESRSGTSTKGRLEYNRLYLDLLTDKFDVIVIKSQDRLMRNTKDWYLFVDRLAASGKKLYIYIERKFYTTDDALITGIKAILAEDYSRELSKKINNAHRRRQEKEGTPILTGRTYGYKQLPDHSVILIEEEAAVKRRMYELCAAGMGMRTIARILESEGIVNRSGRPFRSSRILEIIRSPMNKGTVILNKRHYDFDSKTMMKNPPEACYVYENRIPPTVSEELWYRANRSIDERSGKKADSQRPYPAGKNPGTSVFSGKLYCGFCGAPYYRQARSTRGEKRKYDWKCREYIEYGRNDPSRIRVPGKTPQAAEKHGCSNIHMEETALFTFMEAFCKERDTRDKKAVIQKITKILGQVLQQENVQSEIQTEEKRTEKLRKQMDVLLDKLLEGMIPDEVYKRKQEELKRCLEESGQNLKNLNEKKLRQKTVGERVSRIRKLLEDGELYDEAVMAERMEEIDRIMIYPDCMKLFFHRTERTSCGNELKDRAKSEPLTVWYGTLFDYGQQKKKEREELLKCFRNHPEITAKQLAEEKGCSLSGMNYKLNCLKKEGLLWYDRKKRRWEVKNDRSMQK